MDSIQRIDFSSSKTSNTCKSIWNEGQPKVSKINEKVKIKLMLSNGREWKGVLDYINKDKYDNKIKRKVNKGKNSILNKD